MLKINDLSMSFNGKNIFNNTDFTAPSGKMTAITGRSGKGKSTLLKAIVFEYKSDYYYNDNYITDLNNDEKRKFIFQKISYIKQIPQFINDFTIEQHIELIKKIYGIIEEKNNYLEKLGIEKILDKYPKQLSGGQKTRVAIYLGLLKEPEILILDEPTASLDRDNISKVIKILASYSKLGHTVIVSSHDHQLIKHCDVKYAIHNYKLCIISEKVEPTIKYENKKISNFSKNGYYKYWRLLDSRHRCYNIIMGILLSLSILITIFSNNFSVGANSSYKNQLNSLSSLELLVYKEKENGEYYSFSGDEFPFSEAEIDKIKKIKYIVNVDWAYHTILNADTIIPLYTSYNIKSDENLMNVTLYDEENIIESKNLNDCAIDFRTFKSTINKKNLKHDFNNKGIIISSELYKKIVGDKKVTYPYLEFVALIPKYDATNLTYYYPEGDQESQTAVPCNTALGEYRKLKIPIAGVINDEALINGAPVPEYCIYIDNAQLEDYIKDSYPKEGRIFYEVLTPEGEYVIFYNSIPENINSDSVTLTTTESPWRPNSYVIEVDDISNLNTVAKEISELGYGIESEYVDSTSFNLLSEENSHVLIISITSIFILLYAFYIYLKYLALNNELGLNNFLAGLGLMDKQIKMLNNQRYRYKVLKLFLLTSIMFVAIVEFAVHEQILLFIIKPDIKIFVYILIVSILIEFLIPKLIENFSKIYKRNKVK